MTCPACSQVLTADDLVIDGRIGVCQRCARSVVLEDVKDGEGFPVATLRLAARVDLEMLDDSQVKALRKARPKAWRDAVLATKARIKGR